MSSNNTNYELRIIETNSTPQTASATIAADPISCIAADEAALHRVKQGVACLRGEEGGAIDDVRAKIQRAEILLRRARAMFTQGRAITGVIGGTEGDANRVPVAQEEDNIDEDEENRPSDDDDAIVDNAREEV